MIGAARNGRDVATSGELVREAGARRRRRRPPWWTSLGLFSPEPALDENAGLATHREAQLRSAIRSVIPD